MSDIMKLMVWSVERGACGAWSVDRTLVTVVVATCYRLASRLVCVTDCTGMTESIDRSIDRSMINDQ
jgi:hypothetical protein